MLRTIGATAAPFIIRRKLSSTTARFNSPSSYHPKKDAATPAELRRYERQEGLKGFVSGVFAVAGILTVFALYQNYDHLYKSVFYGIKPDDDEILNKVKDQAKRKRGGKNFTELPVLTNDKDSSVPGVYLWGDNSNLVVSPDFKIAELKFPLRYDWFDGMRLKLVRTFAKSGVAINDEGDLIQWGLGFGKKLGMPRVTVKGQQLVDAKVSNGIVYCQTKRGDILLVPESHKDQEDQRQQQQQQQQHLALLSPKFFRWKFWSSESMTNFPKLDTTSLSKGEYITSFAVGQQHLLALSNKKQVYTTTTGQHPIIAKSHGQFGLINHNQFQTPPSSNILQPIPLLNYNIDTKSKKLSQRHIEQIACGDNHSVALDSTGTIWAFGENYMGQLGLDIQGYDNELSPVPRKVDLLKHQIIPRDYFPMVKTIKASGDSTFAEIKPVKMFKLVRNITLGGGGGDAVLPGDNDEELDTQYIGFGSNLKGQLGSGKFIHSQHVPSKIANLSQLKDYDESLNEMVTIPVREWSFCNDHTFLTLENNDVLHWGANDHGELGNGKKNRVPKPAAMQALVEPGYTLEQVNKREFVNRLSVRDGMKIVAGFNTGCIYYEK